MGNALDAVDENPFIRELNAPVSKRDSDKGPFGDAVVVSLAYSSLPTAVLLPLEP